MYRQYIGMIFCHGPEYDRQKPRLIIHLKNHRDGLSFTVFMERKNIIFIFVKRTPADTYSLCSFLHRCDFF